MDDTTSTPAAALAAWPLWRTALRALAACAALALGLGAAFVALLALALSLTDDARIAANLADAARTGAFAADSYPLSPFGHGGHRYDMYTDCIAFGMNLSTQPQPLLRRIAASPTAAREGGDGPCEDLAAAVRAGEVRADHAYLRFWHGYQVYLRPLLSLLPFDAVLRLTAILFFATLVFFAYRIDGVFGAWSWAIALAPFFLLSDFFTVPMVATHAISLICAFLPAALVPALLRIPNARRLALPLFAFGAGAVYNFLNFLINPPLAPALIAFMYLGASIGRDGRQSWREALYAFVLAGLWFAGFAAAWVEKWLFAALALGPDAVAAEIARTVEKYEATRARLDVNFLGASRRNVQYTWPMFGYLLASIAVAAALAAWTVRKYGAWRARSFAFLALVSPLIWIVLWVEANRAHSAEHVGFVSRSFLLFSVFPLLAALKLWRHARRAA